jgi:diguanylate cyclase
MGDLEWKNKARLLGEKLDAEIRRFRESEELLRRTLGRVCAATQGLDPALDPHLGRLRALVRDKDVSAIETEVARLVEALVKAGEAPRPAELVHRLLGLLRLPAAQRRKAEDLWHGILASPGAELPARLEALAGLIAAPSPGAAGPAPAAPQAAAAAPNQRLRDLLDHVRWPEAIAEEIRELRERLAEDAPDDAWVSVVERLASIVAKTVVDARDQVQAAEEFLAELGARLKELDAHVQGSAALRSESLESGRELDRVVSGEVSGIKESVRTARELDALRESVTARLATIEAGMARHLAAEEERHATATANEQALRQRLDDLEQEAVGLRQEIAAAQTRAMLDAVTGLPNRSAYDARVRQEHARHKRFGTPLVVCVFDIDDFKSINDRFGHVAGDKALRVIGRTLEQRLRETDFIARYGGEEFVVLLVGAGADAAFAVAEEMRQAVARCGLHTRSKPIQVTISCGLTELRPGDTVDRAFERADSALYEAKRLGKNRCVRK